MSVINVCTLYRYPKSGWRVTINDPVQRTDSIEYAEQTNKYLIYYIYLTEHGHSECWTTCLTYLISTLKVY
jgi:hypothetical protein